MPAHITDVDVADFLADAQGPSGRPWGERRRRTATYVFAAWTRYLAELDLTVAAATPAACRAYFDPAGAVASTREPSTMLAHYSYLRALYAYLAREELLDLSGRPDVRPGRDPNPMRGIVAPRVADNVPQITATDADVEALLATFDRRDAVGSRNAAIIALLWASGCRVGEIAYVDLDDVDLEARTITFPHTKTDTARTVRLAEEPRKLIARYIRRHRGTEPGPLFVTSGRRSSGERMPTASIQTMFKRAAVTAGLKVTPHSLRRGRACAWLLGGGSQVGLQTNAGWSDHRMVGRYTAAVREQIAQQEYDRLFPAAAPVRAVRGRTSALRAVG